MVKQIIWDGGSIPSYPSFLTDNQQKQIGVKKHVNMRESVW